MGSSIFIADERIHKQQNNWAVFRRFLGSLLGLRRWIIPILFCIAVAATLPQFYLWYVGKFVNCADQPACHGDFLGLTLPFSLGGLFLIAALAACFRIGSWAAFEIVGQLSTNGLHDRMIHALARTRTTYFDENPSGRLINRIVGDFGSLRMMGIIRMGDSVNAAIEVLAVTALVGLVSVVPALCILPLGWLFVKSQIDIGPMLGRVQEFSSRAKGQFLHRETDLIDGSSVFRLYQKEPHLLGRISSAYGEYANAQLLNTRLQAWSRSWVRGVSAVYCAVVFIFVGLALERGQLDAALAAVIISAVLSLAGVFGWLSWCLAFMGETLGNARRVFDITDLPCETASEGNVSAQAGTSAALTGDICFKDFHMSYRQDTAEILRGLNLTLPAGKRIGIIGRTGSGKSSLLQALFRMVYVRSGDITIGGRSIYAIDIEHLRAHFGVLPQHPYLFAGTLARNLDPAGAMPRENLVRALREVGIAQPLETAITEGGQNLSVGERQLVCLARLVLQDKPYILMDEPTSSLDQQTDHKIQELTRRLFAGKTVITIAHRLETLAEYDVTIEMRDGTTA